MTWSHIQYFMNTTQGKASGEGVDPDSSRLRVAVALREQRIAVEVTNPIPERGGHSDGHHMALSNIEQRLQALYGTQGLLQSEATEAAYRITLSYPVTP